jgi:protein-tyrosine kinase
VSLIEKAASRLAQTIGLDKSLSNPNADDMGRVAIPEVEGAADGHALAEAKKRDDLQRQQQRTTVTGRHAAASRVDLDESRREPSLVHPTITGTINLARLKQAGMITPDGERTHIAEEFRHVKRPLLMNAFNQGAVPVKNGNLIMVSSSLPGEGKSFTSINLAMSIAMEMDHTVLLIDADVAKPSIPQFLGLKADRGLLDILRDDSVKLSDVLIKTNVEKLTILPAGRGHRYSTELLASINMRKLIDEMAQRYPDRIIIFDSPPLLLTSESRVLASHMGQIVVVVEAGKTTHEAIREALKHIEHCEVIGMVLNKGKFTPGSGYYGGYYGSYYGGYSYGK